MAQKFLEKRDHIYFFSLKEGLGQRIVLVQWQRFGISLELSLLAHQVSSIGRDDIAGGIHSGVVGIQQASISLSLPLANVVASIASIAKTIAAIAIAKTKIARLSLSLPLAN